MSHASRGRDDAINQMTTKNIYDILESTENQTSNQMTSYQRRKALTACNVKPPGELELKQLTQR